MQLKSKQQVPANAELITKMVELGNLGQNVRITGETKEERLKKFREVYYGSSPWYIDLYHARISKYNDPLLVIRRDDVASFSIRFLTDHDTMFGTKEQKNYPEIMRKIRQRIDALIQQGNK